VIIITKQTLAIVLALGVIASVGYFGGSYVMAGDTNPMHDSLITKIAQKFNLKEADVEAVFESVRDERQEEMKANRQEKLSQAVKDGVITEAQKNTLLAKMEEHIGERRENREEMQNWFKSQGIDETKLREYMRPVGKGMGEGRQRGI
jgi:Spy/CpxP family protein refolding chaperone